MPDHRSRLADNWTIGKRLAEAWQRRRQSSDDSCLRCGMPWDCVSPRDVMTSDRSGMFAICVACWAELATAEARMPFYLLLFERWEHECPGSVTDQDRAALVAAVQRESEAS